MDTLEQLIRIILQKVKQLQCNTLLLVDGVEDRSSVADTVYIHSVTVDNKKHLTFNYTLEDPTDYGDYNPADLHSELNEKFEYGWIEEDSINLEALLSVANESRVSESTSI